MICCLPQIRNHLNQLHGSDKGLGHGVDHYNGIMLEHENILKLLNEETFDTSTGEMLTGWDRVNNSDFLRLIKTEVSYAVARLHVRSSHRGMIQRTKQTSQMGCLLIHFNVVVLCV